MNKVTALFRRSVLSVLAVASSGILLTSCLKNKDDNNSNIPAAGVMAFNLAPDQNPVVVTLNGNVLTRTPLGFTNYTGGYNPVYTGNRTIETYTYPGSNKLASSSYAFEADKYYSLYLIGIDSNYRQVVSVDNFDSLSATSGNAYIRYINAITDSVNASTVTITAGSTEVTNESAGYGQVGAFKAVAPGSVTIAVKNSNGVNANRTITVEQKKVYTVLLAGVPSATDEVKKVQVRYVQNGTLTEDPTK